MTEHALTRLGPRPSPVPSPAAAARAHARTCSTSAMVSERVDAGQPACHGGRPLGAHESGSGGAAGVGGAASSPVGLAAQPGVERAEPGAVLAHPAGLTRSARVSPVRLRAPAWLRPPMSMPMVVIRRPPSRGPPRGARSSRSTSADGPPTVHRRRIPITVHDQASGAGRESQRSSADRPDRQSPRGGLCHRRPLHGVYISTCRACIGGWGA